MGLHIISYILIYSLDIIHDVIRRTHCENMLCNLGLSENPKDLCLGNDLLTSYIEIRQYWLKYCKVIEYILIWKHIFYFFH